MAQKKQFKALDLSNAFLFAAALEDEETCRLDIFASDGLNVGYNLEMQNADEKDLPQRSRYHQAEMDLSSLKPGQDFKELKPSVIIFICNFDPFGKRLYRYTFEARCLEEDFPLEDGTKRIFLSTVGKNERDVPKELVCFLKYVMDSTDARVVQSGDWRLGKIHERIKTLKQSRELEERYMQFEEMLKKEHEDGAWKMWELVSRMIADGKTDMIPRLKSEENFYKEMLQEYQI